MYPDGLAVRQVIAYPGDESGFGGNPNFWQIIEWIVIHGTNTRPDLSLHKNPALSFLNDKGDSVSIEYPIQFESFQPLCHAFPQIKDWDMYVGFVHLVERPNPFVVLAKDESGSDGDTLDLADLLQGEENNPLTDYLQFSAGNFDGDGDATDTKISIDHDGGATFQTTQEIVLNDVDLTAGGSLANQDIINDLLNNKNLETD